MIFRPLNTRDWHLRWVWRAWSTEDQCWIFLQRAEARQVECALGFQWQYRIPRTPEFEVARHCRNWADTCRPPVCDACKVSTP